MTPSPRLLAPTLLCAGLLAAAGVRAAAVDLVTPGTEWDGTPYTLGFEFTVNEAVQLNALGVYDSGADGLEWPGQAALWLASGGAALAQVALPAGTAATLEGSFRYVAVTPVLLSPGVHYVVGAFLDGGLATSLGLGQGGSGTFDARLNVVADRYGAYFALGFPDSSDGAAGAWLGANFLLSAVPEPAPAGLLAAGLAVLGLWRQRRAARAD